MVVMVSSKVSSRSREREGFRRPSDREDIDYRGRGQLGLLMPHPGLRRLARQVSFRDARRYEDLLLNLTKRLLAAIEREMPRKEAVRILGVSLATIKRWLKRGPPSLSMQRG